jgi:hypothetical protein
MPLVPKTYEVNSPQAKFRSTVEIYNPTIVEHYDASNDMVRRDEIFDGKMYSQTISGTTTHTGTAISTVTYSAWVETTV